MKASRWVVAFIACGLGISAVLAFVSPGAAQEKKVEKASEKKVEKAQKAAAGKSLGYVTCDKERHPVLSVGAAYIASKQDLMVAYFSVDTTAEERKWYLASAAFLRDKSGKILSPAEVGVTGEILKDFKRQNEIQGHRVMQVHSRPYKKFGPTLDLASVETLVNSTISIYCGRSVNVILTRGPGNAEKANVDYKVYSADLKDGGKASFVMKGDVKPKPDDKSSPNIPVSWDIKAETTIIAFE